MIVTEPSELVTSVAPVLVPVLELALVEKPVCIVSASPKAVLLASSTTPAAV